MINVVLILSFIVFGMVTFIKVYILSGDAFFDTLESKDIYSVVYDSLDSYYQEQYNVTGIPKDVYLSVIDLEEIEIITNDLTYHGIDYIKGNPNSLNVTYNFENLEKSIDTFFDSYAKSINYQKDEVYYNKVSEVTQNAENKITSECDAFNFNTLKSSGVLDKLARYVPYVDYVQIGVSILIVVLLALMVVLNGKHYIFDNVYWLGTSVSISSLVVLIPCIYLKCTDYFTSFAVKSDTIFNSVTGLLNVVLKDLTTIWIVLLCIGVVLFFLGLSINISKKR